jgi:Gram-negative bacterial TonB protein C-terminal
VGWRSTVFALASLLMLGAPAWAQADGEPAPPHAQAPESGKVPKGVILVKGAWASASDSTAPLPEGGSIANDAYTNNYFGLSYPLPADFYQQYTGPPPSDSGYYVLAQLVPAGTFKGPARGSVLIAAQDLFFGLTPADNAAELMNVIREGLKADYKVETPPTQVTIGGHSFVRFGYTAPVADLHWYIFSTEIRCHMLEFIFTSRDTQLLDKFTAGLSALNLPATADPTKGTGGGDAPVCIKDYATGANVLHRVDPVPTEHRFNPVPVRIIIGKDGSVEHVHFLSAFPDQAKAITDAVMQWKFKPYLENGQPVEVETGVMFGYAQRPKTAARSTARPAATN